MKTSPSPLDIAISRMRMPTCEQGLLLLGKLCHELTRP